MITVADILQDIEDTDPIIIAAVATALLGVCAWTASIYLSIRSKQEGRGRRRGKVRRGNAAPPRVTQENLAPLVRALKPHERQVLGDDVAKLLERHRNKRFLAFVVVTRTNITPYSFAFLYHALRAQSRPIGEVHEFQISVRDANEILKACLTEESHA
jgi:hypothetical protein